MRLLLLLLLLPAHVAGMQLVAEAQAEGGSSTGVEVEPEPQQATATSGCEDVCMATVAVSITGGSFTALGLWAWFAKLRWLPALGLFTRLRRDKLLDHPLRSEIHALIEAEPGLHRQLIAKRLGKSASTINHHLATLVRGGLLRRVTKGGCQSYFLVGSLNSAVMLGMSVVKSSTARQLLRTYATRGGASNRALASEIGCADSTLRHHLSRFEEAGLVMGQELTPTGQAVLARLDPMRPAAPPGIAA